MIVTFTASSFCFRSASVLKEVEAKEEDPKKNLLGRHGRELVVVVGGEEG